MQHMRAVRRETDPNALTGGVLITIYGSIQDMPHWEKCTAQSSLPGEKYYKENCSVFQALLLTEATRQRPHGCWTGCYKKKIPRGGLGEPRRAGQQDNGRFIYNRTQRIHTLIKNYKEYRKTLWERERDQCWLSLSTGAGAENLKKKKKSTTISGRNLKLELTQDSTARLARASPAPFFHPWFLAD